MTEARPVLIVGCGNASRTDDGVGLHVIRRLCAHFGLPLDEGSDEMRVAGAVQANTGPVPIELRFEQQLDIVLADELGGVALFVVVDAHTGVHPEAIRRVGVSPGYTSSLTSHHLTPETLVALAHAFHGRAPHTLVYSVRGYDFNFGSELTPATREAADQVALEVVELVEKWAAGIRCPQGEDTQCTRRI